MRELNWFEPGRGASESEVGNLERVLGLQLPRDFVEYLLRNAGASSPDENEFPVIDCDGNTNISNFGVLLPPFCEDGESIVGDLSDLGEQIPAGLLPVVGTGGGDYVCLDFRSGVGVSVVYFFHEETGDNAFVPLSATFSEFLDM